MRFIKIDRWMKRWYFPPSLRSPMGEKGFQKKGNPKKVEH